MYVALVGQVGVLWGIIYFYENTYTIQYRIKNHYLNMAQNFHLFGMFFAPPRTKSNRYDD